METNFKAGDKVRVVDSGANFYLKKGAEHIVERTYGNYVVLVGDLEGTPYFSHRFVLAPRTTAERIAEQEALIAEKTTLLAETRESIKKAKALVAELSQPQPPQVGDMIDGSRVEGVFRWRGGWMVVRQFGDEVDRRYSDIPRLDHWFDGQFQPKWDNKLRNV